MIGRYNRLFIGTEYLNSLAIIIYKIPTTVLIVTNISFGARKFPSDHESIQFIVKLKTLYNTCDNYQLIFLSC